MADLDTALDLAMGNWFSPEFKAESFVYNGKPCTGRIVRELSAHNEYGNQGVKQELLTVVVPLVQIGAVPVAGTEQHINGHFYIVVRAATDNGILEIAAIRNVVKS
ncbi:MAG: hypothetical protein GY874_17875 [Desulfobacteraceae bacterium]|nr:hypothetical protein [Desulfobacteraceae bacterium]